ncbi:CD276 antigen-like isoform X3 [Protopterus annectens]|uniref:CD276 antigen-like isoform X3 n=1 Tax=Protopterus annectens TaxID=7888 RepID=UPI001CFBE8ED|nr:CD276 antigen-like isoform X3 [Protopterus annectens]
MNQQGCNRRTEMQCNFVVKMLLSLIFSIKPCYAALTVNTENSVTAYRGFNVLLGCNFTTEKEIKLDNLQVAWNLENTEVLKFDDSVSCNRTGAKLFMDELAKGNVSLYLSNVQDADQGVYTCRVLHAPEIAEGTVNLTLKENGNSNTGHQIIPETLIFWTALTMTFLLHMAVRHPL